MDIKHLLLRSILELKKAGITTAELDAKVLAIASLNKDSVFIYSHSEYLPTNNEYAKFRGFIRRRKKLEPIAYILGHKEFYGNYFFVNKNTLIPRPETEFLVEEALAIIKDELNVNSNQNISIIDMGTGSGCIIISLILELIESNLLNTNLSFHATDISEKSLYIARKNAKKFNVNKHIKFFYSDLFENRRLPKQFDIVIANLPYVPIKSKSKKKESIDFEPQDAIFAQNNGMEIVLSLLNYVKSNNNARYILLELDSRNAEDLDKIAKTLFPKASITLKMDLAGLARYLFIKL